jgi:hypothetical protein
MLIPILSFHVYGDDGILIDLDIWTEVSETIPSMEPEDDIYLSDSEIYKRTLEDAVWIISGMIYGFDVIYTPLDRSRSVEEFLNISPIATIPWGDEKLKIVETWFQNGKFSMHVRYSPDSSQALRLKLWESNIFPEAEGTGTTSIFSGYKGRIESIKEGIKEALRNYLRIRNLNKPREITCRVLLNTSPYTIMNAGRYKSKVGITIKFNDVTPYSYY